MTAIEGTVNGDTLDGGGEDDTINGNAGDDRILGGAGNDTISGGDGADTIDGGAGLDVIYDNTPTSPDFDPVLDDDADRLTGEFVYSTGGADTLTGNTVVVDRRGSPVAVDFIDGVFSDGTRVHSGEIVYHGTGRGDVYQAREISAGSTGVNNLSTVYGYGGDDVISADGGRSLWFDSNTGHHRFYGGVGNDTLSAEPATYENERIGVPTLLDGGDGNDMLIGSTGDDTVMGGAGDDYFDDRGQAGRWVSYDFGHETIHEYELYTSTGNDLVTGGDGDDTLTSVTGSDTLDGGDGNDTVIISNTSSSRVDPNDPDTILFDDGMMLRRVETTILTAYEGDFETGRFDDRITARSGATIKAGAGNDIVTAIEDGSVVDGQDGDDSLSAEGIATLRGGAGSDDIVLDHGGRAEGGGDDDILRSLSGTSMMNGGAGDDQIIGSAGRDVVSFSHLTRGIALNLGASGVEDSVILTIDGIDTLTSIEDAEGGQGDDHLIAAGRVGSALSGLAGDDTLRGVGGDDTLEGGAGDDEIIGNGGRDRVSFASMNRGVSINLKNNILTVNGTDTLTGIEDAEGGKGDDHLVATSADTGLYGLAGDDTLRGQGGNDTLSGAAGEDSLLGNRGNDTLGGAAGEDSLFGNRGDDVLDGGNGQDTMVGGEGDDIYYVAIAGDDHMSAIKDVVVEAAGEGYDTVRSWIRLNLDPNVERLELQGQADVGRGNGEDNIIYGQDEDNALYGLRGDDKLHGRSGNDTLDGGPGADKLYGGRGDDVYIVDGLDDQVLEGQDKGHDTVRTHISGYVLADNVETLHLVGSASQVGTGNDGDNTLMAEGGRDTLYGMGGDDTLMGGPGDSRLIGGEGGDLYLLGINRTDVIVLTDRHDSGVSEGARDTIRYFRTGEDLIDVSGLDADVTTAGHQTFAFIGNAEFTEAGQIRREGGNVISMNLDDDTDAEMMIEVDVRLFADDFIF